MALYLTSPDGDTHAWRASSVLHGAGPPVPTVLLVADPVAGSLTAQRGAALLELLRERLADGLPARAVTLAEPVVIELAGLQLPLAETAGANADRDAQGHTAARSTTETTETTGTAAATSTVWGTDPLARAAAITEGALAAAVYAVLGARLLVVAAPAAEVTSSGLLRRFLDLLPGDALDGTVAVTLLTVPRPTNRHEASSRLTTALTGLGAVAPTRSLTVLDSAFADLPAALESWTGLALTALRGVLAGESRSTGVWTAGTGSARTSPSLQIVANGMDG